MAFFTISRMVLGLLDSTGDLLRVVSDRIVRVFNRSGATRAVALDISQACRTFSSSLLCTIITCNQQFISLPVFLESQNVFYLPVKPLVRDNEKKG